MTLDLYKRVTRAEDGIASQWELDEPNNKASQLTDSVGSNHIALGGSEAGDFNELMDSGIALGVRGIGITTQAFTGGSAGTITRNMAISALIKFDGTPSALARIATFVVDGNNGMYAILGESGGLDFRNEIANSGLGSVDGIYTSANGLLLVAWIIEGTSRDILVNGASVSPTNQTSGIGAAGSSNEVTIGGNGNDGQLFPGAIAMVSDFREWSTTPDFSAHHAALYNRTPQVMHHRRLMGAA